MEAAPTPLPTAPALTSARRYLGVDRKPRNLEGRSGRRLVDLEQPAATYRRNTQERLLSDLPGIYLVVENVADLSEAHL